MPPALIYCGDGNVRYGALAMRHNVAYGSRLPGKMYHVPYFADQDWRKPDRDKYVSLVQKAKPALATVLDLEREEQLPEVMEWARLIAPFVRKAIIIIPKAQGIISKIPDAIAGVPVRLGYSVPTRYGGTEVPLWEFGQRPVHLLGGSPKKQLDLMHYLNVQSADGNMASKMAAYGQYFVNGGWRGGGDRYWPKLHYGYGYVDKPMYPAFELSMMNLVAANVGTTAMIRFARQEDVPAVQTLSRQWDAELGRVMRPALEAAVAKQELYVADYGGRVVGFVNWHMRRDGWSTIYEIAVDRAWLGHRIGAGLLAVAPRPLRLKVTQDNDRANAFYQQAGMTMIRIEEGRKRPLNVYELRQWWDADYVQAKIAY